MARAIGHQSWTVGVVARCAAAFLAAAFVVSVLGPSPPAVAGQLRCASHSLSRQEIAHAEAVARPALPSRVHLVVTGACWNRDFARVGLETPKVLTPAGVQQKWVVWCNRYELAWTCDPPEFQQSILVTLPVANEVRRVELNFDKLISLERARALTARALAIYGDPAARIPTCSGEDIENPPSDPHGTDSLARANPIHVTVSRNETKDSVELEEVYREFEFPLSGEPEMQTPCWLDVIVVT